ncbi:hypothetical protein HYW60_00255 [Candidatus Kaiserbacteria bacterium]|nr:hypothetical protein [Candidatus Kaiserbacteria bacterium]
MIMILEMNPDARERMKVALVEAGYSVRGFDDKEALIEALCQDPHSCELVLIGNGNQSSLFDAMNMYSFLDSVPRASVGKAIPGDTDRKERLVRVVKRSKRAL